MKKSLFSSFFLRLVLALPLLFFPLTITAQGGYTLDFSGLAYVEIPHDASFDIGGGDFTVEGWIKASGAGTTRTILNKNDMFGGSIRIALTTGNKLECATAIMGDGDNTVTSSASIGSDWTHFAIVRIGSTLYIYLNGLADNSNAGGLYDFDNTENLFLGAEFAFSSQYNFFSGKIDEIRIWSDARTQAEIQANMYRTLTGSEANLVAWYSMSNGSGTTLTDNSDNSNDGTLNNSPSWKTSAALAGPRMALDFDGVDDYVFAPINAAATATLTIEGWFSFNSLTGQQNIINLHQTSNPTIRFVPYKTAANEVALFVHDGSNSYVTISTFTIAQANVWHHLVFIYNAGAISIYANGNLVGSATGQGIFSTAATNLFSVGADFNGTGASFYANIKADEVRIWSDVRTEAEIRAYKDRALDGDEANLLAYYRFDQQADAGNTTEYDLTANGHDGTLTSMNPATDWVASTPFNTWIGSEDGDWSDAQNWGSGTVPSTEDVGVFAWAGSHAPASANISGRNFYIASDATLSHSGNLTLSGDYYNAGTFTTTGNVTFSGTSAQTLGGSGTSTFGTLTLNNSTGLTLEQGVSVTGALGLTAGVLDLNSQTLSLGSAATVSGSPGSSNHVNASSGVLRKYYASTGSFAFPVGDGTTYSPITLNFTAGTFSTGYANVGLTAVRHPNNGSSCDYLNRYWTVSSSGISSFTCAVSAQYADGDISGSEGSLYGGKYSAGDWTSLGVVTTADNLITGTVSSFSDFTAGEESVFPVEWLSFGAKAEGDLVRLDWTTATELNNDYFAVERSTDQQSWSTLAQVIAAGYSSTAQNYRYDDTQPLNGKTWYRLRQVDLDGSFDYSNVVEISRHAGLVSIYPNPVKDKLTIETQGQTPVTARLFDMQGRVVMQQTLNSGNPTLSVHNLPSGIYLIRLSNEKGWTQEMQVVKE